MKSGVIHMVSHFMEDYKSFCVQKLDMRAFIVYDKREVYFKLLAGGL